MAWTFSVQWPVCSLPCSSGWDSSRASRRIVRNALPRLPLPTFTLHNFDDVDRGLREWRSRLEVVDDNLRELDDEPTLRKLEGRPGLPAASLAGETAARVGPALRALRDVWAYRDRLADAID